jgi:hypothetical protein
MQAGKSASLVLTSIWCWHRAGRLEATDSTHDHLGIEAKAMTDTGGEKLEQRAKLSS